MNNINTIGQYLSTLQQNMVSLATNLQAARAEIKALKAEVDARNTMSNSSTNSCDIEKVLEAITPTIEKTITQKTEEISRDILKSIATKLDEDISSKLDDKLKAICITETQADSLAQINNILNSLPELTPQLTTSSELNDHNETGEVIQKKKKVGKKATKLGNSVDI